MLVQVVVVSYNIMKLCKDCVNYLIDIETEKTWCDFGYFDDVEIYKSYLYIPEEFDCDEWELLKED